MIAIKKNGFISVAGICDKNESERRALIAKRTIPEKMNKIVLVVLGLVFFVGLIHFGYKVITAPKAPILVVNAAMVVQEVRLPNGTVISGQDPRVWSYIRHKPSYKIEYNTH